MIEFERKLLKLKEGLFFRLIRDNFAMRKESLVQGSAAPDTNDVLKWKGCLFGPTDTPFEDGSFFIKVSHLRLSLLKYSIETSIAL